MNEELKKRLLTESKSFCVAPWMSLYVHPNGDVLPCCNWDLDSPIGNANDNSIDQIYNSEVNSNIRKKMINGTFWKLLDTPKADKATQERQAIYSKSKMN